MVLRLFLFIVLSFAAVVSSAAGWTDLKANTSIPGAKLSNIVTSSYSNVFIRANKNSKFQLFQFNPRNGNWEQVTLPTGVSPYNIFPDSCGDLDVLSPKGSNYNIWKYSSANRSWVQAQNSQIISSLIGIYSEATIGPSGNLYIPGMDASNNNTVFKYNCGSNIWQNTHQQTGKATVLMATLSADHYGHVFASLSNGNKNQVWRDDSLYYNPSTKQFGQWINTNTSAGDIYKIATDGYGNLYEIAMDKGSMNLWKYTAQTKQWTEIKSGLITGLNFSLTLMSLHMTADSQGNLYVAVSGGKDQKSQTTVVGVYNTIAKSWATIPTNFSKTTGAHGLWVDRFHNVYVLMFVSLQHYDLWEYNFRSQQWTDLSAGLGSNYIKDPQVAQDHRNNLYAITTNKRGVDDVWKYTP